MSTRFPAGIPDPRAGVLETAQHQSRADKEQKRDRHLGNDKQAAQSPPADSDRGLHAAFFRPSTTVSRAASAGAVPESTLVSTATANVKSSTVRPYEFRAPAA